MLSRKERKDKKSSNAGLKVIPGMCCSIDPDNTLGEKENGATHVIVLQCVKKKPFRNSIWRVRDFDASPKAPTMDIVEWRLYPENMALIRYPDDMPTINAEDMKAIKGVIKLMESNDILKGIIGTDFLNRTKALYEKLKYYYEMRNV